MSIAATAENAITRNNCLIETVCIYYGTPGGTVFWVLGDPICGGEVDVGGEFDCEGVLIGLLLGTNWLLLLLWLNYNSTWSIAAGCADIVRIVLYHNINNSRITTDRSSITIHSFETEC